MLGGVVECLAGVMVARMQGEDCHWLRLGNCLIGGYFGVGRDVSGGSRKVSNGSRVCGCRCFNRLLDGGGSSVDIAASSEELGD